MNKKWLMVALMFVLAFGSACSSSKDGKSTETPSKTDSGIVKGSEDNEDPYLGKYAEGLTIDIVRSIASGDYAMYENETTKENIWTNYVKEQLGITFNYKWEVPAGQYEERLKLSLANGDIPDVFTINANDPLFAELAQDGLIQPLDDYYEKHLLPEVKNIIQNADYTLERAKVDGKLYGLPLPTGKFFGPQVLWIREDWLKDLNLSIPETIEELKQVAQAFKNKDLNKNGQKDEIGMAACNDLMECNAGFLTAFNAVQYQWIDDGKGNAVYSSIQPQMKDALAELRNWYIEGLMDREYLIKDMGKWSEDIMAEKAGIMYHPYWGGDWPGTTATPEAKWIAIPNPVGPNGKQHLYVPPYHGGNVIVVNSKFEHPEAIMKNMNLEYKGAFAEDAVFGHGEFLENRHYTNKDGKTVPVNENYAFLGWFFALYQWFPADHESDVAKVISQDPNQLEGIQKLRYETLKDTPRGTYWPAVNVQAEILSNTNSNVIEPIWVYGPTETMKSRGSTLKTLEDEMFAQIITGEIPLDSFDNFVQQWKQQGGDQIALEINEFLSKR